MSLAKLLSAAEETRMAPERIEAVITELKAALNLANSEALPTAFSSDLSALITNAVTLVNHLASPTFPSREVLDHIHRIRSILYSLESYVRNTQVSYTGFCVTNSRSSKMYPNLCFTYAQAEELRTNLASAFGIPIQDLSIETVIYSSTRVNQPLSVPANVLPAPSTPIPPAPAPVTPADPSPSVPTAVAPAEPIFTTPLSPEVAPVKD